MRNLMIVAAVAVVMCAAMGCDGGVQPMITPDGSNLVDGGQDSAVIIAPDASLPCSSGCDDNIPCTDDICAPAGVCEHRRLHARCATRQICDRALGCIASPPCANATDCADDDPCSIEMCEASTATCTFSILDNDSDGDPPRVCGGTDCDDANASVHVGGVDVCNGIDDNCNGEIDEDFDLPNNPENCGMCGHVCASDEVCVTGVCTSCGMLDAPCCAGTCYNGECTGGTCSCASGTMTCPGDSTRCIDISSDRFNCGVCGNTCSDGKECVGGTCVCPSGRHICGSMCVADDNPTACGTSCEFCAVPDHGSGVCAGSACDIVCDTLYSRMGVSCVGDASLSCTAAGTCNPFDPASCRPSTACRPATGGTACQAVSATPSPEGGSCSAIADCEAGTFCLDFGDGFLCQRLCRQGSTGSCGPDSACNGTISGGDSCINVCRPLPERCNIYTQDCADPSDTCTLATNPETSEQYTGCRPAGSRMHGETCGGSVGSCGHGMICVRPTGAATATCHWVCNSSSGPLCTESGESCSSAVSGWGVGYCRPA